MNAAESIVVELFAVEEKGDLARFHFRCFLVETKRHHNRRKRQFALTEHRQQVIHSTHPSRRLCTDRRVLPIKSASSLVLIHGSASVASLALDDSEWAAMQIRTSVRIGQCHSSHELQL